jgi:hypothetical protein
MADGVPAILIESDGLRAAAIRASPRNCAATECRRRAN